MSGKSSRDRYCCFLLGILATAANFLFFIENNQHLHDGLDHGGVLGLSPPLQKFTGKGMDTKTRSWNKAIQEARQMLAAHSEKAECLIPRVEESKQLSQQFKGGSRPSKPYLNVGFPKCGSSTMFDFFACLGYRASHFNQNVTIRDFEGICMRDSVANGLPPLQTCAQGVDAILQMDVEYPLGIDGYYHKPFRDECFFPQLSILEELHEEAPQSTFFLSFRPLDDWVTSISGWGSTVMLNRFQLCNFPNLPRGIPEDLNNKTLVSASMTEFWCSHVVHLRNFVRDNPSHTLIEMSLYDTMSSAEIMYSLFPTKVSNMSEPTSELSTGCWGHSNENRPQKWLRRKKGKGRRNWLAKQQREEKQKEGH